jgi:hypothetical protein
VNEEYENFHFQNLKTIIQKFKSSIEKRLTKFQLLESKVPDPKSLTTENLHQEKWESDLISSQDAFKISADDPMGKLYHQG